jgi:hypothetical protein
VKATIDICMLIDYSVAKKRQHMLKVRVPMKQPQGSNEEKGLAISQC